MELARRANVTARLGQILGIVSVSLVLAPAAYVATLGEAGWATAITAIDRRSRRRWHIRHRPGDRPHSPEEAGMSIAAH